MIFNADTPSRALPATPLSSLWHPRPQDPLAGAQSGTPPEGEISGNKGPDSLRAALSAISPPRGEAALSAGQPLYAWQKTAGFALASLFLLLAATAPSILAVGVLLVATALFTGVIALRAVALGVLFLPPGARPAVRPADEKPPEENALPLVSVLVPLYREAEMVPGLIAALSALDYPPGKIEFLILVESVDGATQAALAAASLDARFSVLIVPGGEPRTKPRALNYGLSFARGSMAAVYDAEDIPAPQQLRQAVETFNSGQPRVGCVQARLSIYNPSASWLARQFAIEYVVLFTAILPAARRLGWPLPLSGTSNYFPCSVLASAGGWDAFNVTEDADLGLRLARLGWRTELLDSETLEEAAAVFPVWFRQRTRWLKGWMQTYLVHTREPLRLWRELGGWGTIGMHILFAGMLFSVLAHPWFYVAALAGALDRTFFELPGTFAGQMIQAAAFFNLLAGYLVSILLGALAVLRRGHVLLALDALTMPFYWLLISAAAYRALWQLFRAPFYWEKTRHTARPSTQTGN